MKSLLGLSLIISLLTLVQPIMAAELKVMTQNQYLGADLAPLFTAASEAEFNAEAVEALRLIAANRPTERIKAMAAEIAKAEPALVGLQEVFQFQCADLAPSIPEQGCDDPTIRDAFVDHLQETLSALDGTYVATAIVTNANLGVALSVTGFPVLVGVVDRDVILARSDVAASPVDFTPYQGFGICLKSSGQGCNYSVFLQVPTPFPPPFDTINVERGFVAVDATVNGRAYRFVNTHLEERPPDPTDLLSFIQWAQAVELLQILQVTTPLDTSLIVVGDINSSPLHVPILGSLPTPYTQFLEAGYTDGWTQRPGKVPGLTCCQRADLSNHKSELYERIDMIFSLEPPAKVKQARVVGATVSDKTPPPGLGLWPSDHGAVTAEMQF